MSGSLLAAIAIAGIGGATAAGVAYARILRPGRGRQVSPEALFARLCRLHGLDLRSRRLLRQIAQQHRLSQPGLLFVEPQWLEQGRLRGPLAASSAEAATLRDRLFDVPLLRDEGPVADEPRAAAR